MTANPIPRLLLATLCALAGSVALATPIRFTTEFGSITELENPSTGFPHGRTIRIHVTVPAAASADMPLVVMNHGSGGPYGKLSRLAAGELSEISRKWSTLLARLGYVTAFVDGYTTRGFVRDDELIDCHTTSGSRVRSGPCTDDELASGGFADDRSYRLPGEALITATECGDPCVSNAPQRAWDVNFAADHLASAAFAQQLRDAVGVAAASVDPARFYMFGHSDGGITTLAGMFHGHADGEHLPARDAASDTAYPRPRYAAAVAFYPGCFMHGAYRDASKNSLYYPYATTLILHANADDLYRKPDESQPGHCEARLAAARTRMQEDGRDVPFEMVVYTADGQQDAGDRPGVRHGFDQAYWDDVADMDRWLVPEHMSKVHGDALMLQVFALHPDPQRVRLDASPLRRGALPYQAWHFPSLPPTWMVDPATPLQLDPAAVVLSLPTLVQNPYFYDTAGNIDISGATEPRDFAIRYAVDGLPAGLDFDAANFRVSGSVGAAGASFWLLAENGGGRYRQRIDIGADGRVLPGPGVRLDTANGVMRESGAIDVALDLYLARVPAGSRVQFAAVDTAALPAGAATLLDAGLLRIDPAAFAALPATVDVTLDVDGEPLTETLVIETASRFGHPDFQRVRFDSHYDAASVVDYPAQFYDAGSPTSGDGFGFDPDDGGVPTPSASPRIFRNGFEPH